MAETLALGFTVSGLVIAAVSIYYIREHVQKLREVEFE